MERRKLLQALVPVVLTSMTVGGKQVQALEVHSKKKYIVVVNPQAVDVDAIANSPIEENHPLAGAAIWIIHPRPGHTVQDELALYEVDEK